MIEIPVIVNGVPVQATLTDEAITLIAAAITPQPETAEPSPYMTIVEAADYLRCSRQRVDDLLSSRRLERVKEGSRTLIRRSDLDAYLDNNGSGRKRR